MSWIRRNGEEHRGHRASENCVGPGAVCSPIILSSLRVEAGASWRLSYLSNQKAWHCTQRSMETGVPWWPSSVRAVISVEQLGQFMEEKIGDRELFHCAK